MVSARGGNATMSCLGSVGSARWGVSLVLAWFWVAALLLPGADVQAREASKQGKQGVAAAKAKPVASPRAAKSPARASATRGKAVARVGAKRARDGATAARGARRGAAAVARARAAEPPKPSLGHAIGLHAVDDP